MHKTGTTSFQMTAKHTGLGALQYLPLTAKNHALEFATLFEDDPGTFRGHQIARRTPEDLSLMRTRFAQEIGQIMDGFSQTDSCKGVIMSAERMSMPAPRVTAATMHRLKDYFSRWCHDFRVYGYVRAPHSFLTSQYQQLLKQGSKSSLKLDCVWPKYRARFEKFDTVFGRDAVSLRKYDKSTLADGDVVVDLAAQMGIHFDPTDIRRVNEGLSLEATALLFAIQRGGPATGANPDVSKLVKRLSDRLRPVGQHRFTLDQTLTAPLIAEHKDDIAWMEHRLDKPMTEPPQTDAIAIATETELLDHAAAARPLLAATDHTALARRADLPLAKLLEWVDDGLRAP